MKKEFRQACAEVLFVLKHMPLENVNSVPSALIKTFEEFSDKNYVYNIDPSIPLAQNPLLRETLTLLAILNLNYWCTDSLKKKELTDLYQRNDVLRKRQLFFEWNGAIKQGGHGGDR